MKKLLTICLMCLMTLTAMAEGTETHRFRVRVTPNNFRINFRAYSPETEFNNMYSIFSGTPVVRLNSDTIDIDLQLPVGAGIELSLMAYTNKYDDYKLIGWKDQGQTVELKNNSSSTYYWRMPDHDVDLVGTFEYAPSLPDEKEQPAMGSWDPETGTLILEGENKTNPLNFTYEDQDKVLRYIRVGNYREGSNLSFYCSDYPNCTYVDVSRTNVNSFSCNRGYDQEKTNVVEVILPSTIQKLEGNAFEGTNLHTLVLYALTPPQLGSEVYNYETYEKEWKTAFPDCQNMEVRVPAEAVPLYQADERWKEYTILAIDGTYANLTLQLFDKAAEALLAPYKNMRLVLTNKANGQSRNYLIGEKNDYEFRYLTTNTTFKAQILNSRDVEVAVLDNIFLGEENLTVTFPSIKKIHNMSLTLTAEGQQVDDYLYDVTWLNAEGYYMKKTRTLEEMVDNEKVMALVDIDRSLAITYDQPDTMEITIGGAGQPDSIVYALKPIVNTKATFTVVDSVTHKGIDKAVIRVTQLLGNGEAGETVTMTTDSEGKAEGQALATMSQITVTSDIHGTQEFFANLADSTDFRTVFLPANGTSIVLSHTYQAAVPEDEEPVIEQSYADARSLDYELHALLPNGTDSLITHYLVNFPTYTLYQKLPAGSKVRVVATDGRGLVETAEAEGELNENGDVNMTLPIVQCGYVEAVYKKSESTRPALLVFDAETGDLLKKQEFGKYMTMKVNRLAEGNYLVVAMSKGIQYQSVNSKAQLELFQNEKDYVAQEVTVSKGVVSKLTFNKIPLAMTKLETHLSEQRAAWQDNTVMVGSYATFGIHVAIEGVKVSNDPMAARPDMPTDCKLEIHMPQGLSEPSAYRYYWGYHVSSERYGNTWINEKWVSYDDIQEMRRENTPFGFFTPSWAQLTTKATSVWDEEERKLTVEWPRIEETGRMLLYTTPLEVGTFIPEVYLSYTYKGKQYREILETTSLTSAKTGINVPDVVIDPKFKVSGRAQYYEEETDEEDVADSRRATSSKAVERPAQVHEKPKYVTVMDGDQPIGKAEILKDGSWETYVTLANARTLSKHNLYAKIAYPNGVKYQTEAREVLYDPNAVIPLWTKMSFFNHHPLELVNTEVVFDYVNGKASPSSYGFDIRDGVNSDFTFEINLSNNSPEKVYACAVYINTEGPDAEEKVVMAHYNQRKNRWIAYSKFNTRSLPYNVMVEPYYHKDSLGSAEDFKDAYNIMENFFDHEDAKLDSLLARIDQILAQDMAAIEAGDTTLACDPSELTNVLRQIAYHTSGRDFMGENPLTEDITEELKKMIAESQDPLDKLDSMLQDVRKINELGNLVEGFITSDAAGLTAEELLAQGYRRLMLDNGKCVFILTVEGEGWTYVDLEKNLKMVVPPDTQLGRVLAPMMSGRRVFDEVDFITAVEFISNMADEMINTLTKVSDVCSAIIEGIEYYIQEKKVVQVAHMEQMDWNNKHLDLFERTYRNLVLKFEHKALTSSINAAEKVKKAFERFKIGNTVGTLASFYSLANNYKGFSKQDYALWELGKKLPVTNCDDSDKAMALKNEIMNFLFSILPYQSLTLSGDVAAIVAGLTSMKAVPADPTPVTKWTMLLSFGKLAASYAADKIYQSRYEDAWEVFKYRESEIVCDHKKECEQRGDCPKCVDEGTCPNWPKQPKEPKYPKSKPTLDPSGFVYEGVESNRLEGVTATVFYKTTTKDAFGDDVENVYMWDAENYSQVNPQITNVNGEYGWMVTEGLWQVKYEKEGYRTEYSEWLPVPPPQLDVNQAMTNAGEPNVSAVKATQGAVTIEFDKFMLVDSLTENTLFVTHNDEVVSGTIDYMLTNDDSQIMTRISNKVRFVPAKPLPAGQTLTLTVKAGVPSYAGTEMSNDFQQDFEIEAFVEELLVDSAVHIIYDNTTELTIRALPTEAAVGKKASVKVLSDIVATADVSELLFDEEGKAALRITGEAHGTTAAVLQMTDDPDVKKVVVIDVKDETDFICPMPQANCVPGVDLPEGTAIELSCELPEATIYYTLDGTCPCATESGSVKKYVEPIVLNDMLTIKAIATAPGYTDSEIVELKFAVTAIRIVTNSEQLRPDATYTLGGQKVQKNQALPKGIYIRAGKKIVVK